MKQLTMALLAMGPLVVTAQQAPSEDASVDATLVRMQTLIHHAVETAAEGARLVALAAGSEETAIDTLAAERGRAMLSDARRLILDVVAGDAMMQLHSQELTDAENARMIATHQLEQVATSYLNVTERLLGSDEDSATNVAEDPADQ